MKARITHSALLALVVLIMSGVSASQTVIKRTLFRVDVPFTFVAGGNHLPAGEYIVSHVDPNLIEIMKQDGSARALAHVAIEDLDRGGGWQSSAVTKLVFNKYEGEQYFLAQVWTEQDSQVHHCTKCRGELQLVAQGGKSQQRIILARR